MRLQTAALQAPLSTGFSEQEYWSGLPFPFPGHLPNPGIEPMCPGAPALKAGSLLLNHHSLPSPMTLALAGGFFTTSATWEV